MNTAANAGSATYTGPPRPSSAPDAVFGYHGFVMAVERIERRLRQVAAALDAAGIAYAVCGGNAVAAWVSRVDPAATRATKDVDLLVRQADEPRIAEVMRGLGFERRDLRPMVLFIDPEEPAVWRASGGVWASGGV
jgi:hypothetical protein